MLSHRRSHRSVVPSSFSMTKRVRLVICYVILCPHYHIIKTKTTSTTAGGIREVSILRVGSPPVGISVSCPVTIRFRLRVSVRIRVRVSDSASASASVGFFGEYNA